MTTFPILLSPWNGLVKVTLASVLLVVSGTAYSWRIVYDPTNHAETAVSAVNAVKTEISAATSAIQNIKQTIELVKMTTSIDGLAKLAGLEQELGLYRDLTRTNDQLISAINQTKSLTQNLTSQYGASNLTWKQFMEGRAAVDVSQAQALMWKFEQVNRSIESTNKRRESILNQVQNAQGQLAATQGVSAQMDMLIGQNQQIIGLLNTQIAQSAEAKQRNAETDKLGMDQYKQYQDQLKRSAERFNRP